MKLTHSTGHESRTGRIKKNKDKFGVRMNTPFEEVKSRTWISFIWSTIWY